jgi:hypothetical protein
MSFLYVLLLLSYGDILSLSSCLAFFILLRRAMIPSSPFLGGRPGCTGCPDPTPVLCITTLRIATKCSSLNNP